MAQAIGEYRNSIAGEWLESESGERFEDRNPASGELLATFPRSTAADADRAVAAAHEAYNGWRLTPAPKR
ncbi:MAG TPA: aldehyde dehydrogenase family protein, partial [Gaiellales bacterium]|nr:aldehyde dehydrogenase family protein [Gaiellales bacterium]